MRADIYNLSDLKTAMNKADSARDTVELILHTPGQETYRFIVNRFGLERQVCTRTGDPR